MESRLLWVYPSAEAAPNVEFKMNARPLSHTGVRWQALTDEEKFAKSIALPLHNPEIRYSFVLQSIPLRRAGRQFGHRFVSVAGSELLNRIPISIQLGSSFSANYLKVAPSEGRVLTHVPHSTPHLERPSREYIPDLRK